MKISADFAGLDQKFSSGNLRHAREAAANDALQIMNTKYVPMLHTDSNINLRGRSGHTGGGSQLFWRAPYAHAQFIGIVGGKYPVRHYTTPGTSKRWDKRLTGNKQDMDMVKQAFVKGAKW